MGSSEGMQTRKPKTTQTHAQKNKCVGVVSMRRLLGCIIEKIGLLLSLKSASRPSILAMLPTKKAPTMLEEEEEEFT